MFYEHLRFNPVKRVDKKSILFQGLFEQGARYITDIYKDKNELLSYTRLKNRVNIKKKSVSWPDKTSAKLFKKKQNKQLIKKYDIRYLI